MAWDDPRGYDSVVGASAEWSRRHPDVEFSWDARPLQAFADAPLPELAAAYDLLVIDHPHIPAAAAAGILADLRTVDGHGRLDALVGQSVGRSSQSYLWDGRQLALATDAAAQVAVYRADLIAAPPATWAEVIELALEGRVLWPCKPVDAMSTFLTMAANAGHPIEAGSVPGVTIVTDILNRMTTLADLVPSHCLDENPIETAERLATDDRWAYCPFAYGYVNYSRDGYREHRLTYADIPVVYEGIAGSCLGGAGLAVSAASSFVTEAAEFAFWCASAPVQSGVYYTAGGQPGNVVAWEDPALNADSLDFFSGTRATLEQAYLRPATTSWLPVQDELGVAVNAIMRHERTVADGAEQLLEILARV